MKYEKLGLDALGSAPRSAQILELWGKPRVSKMTCKT